ncbi:MAG TPA: D-alanyl-D-alanine carboxypeptidase [Candidatus Ventrimonas merdavium]|nr:D-alanyl-D-alanine carboxypeptidase [Candidatus Ventrimonas merdavium]
MERPYQDDDYEFKRDARRRRRQMEERRRKRRKKQMMVYGILAGAALILILLAVGIVKLIGGLLGGSGPEAGTDGQAPSGVTAEADGPEGNPGAGASTDGGTDEGTGTGIHAGANAGADGEKAAAAGGAGTQTAGAPSLAESQPVKPAGTRTYSAQRTEATQAMDGEVYSNYGIFIDLRTGNILAERNSSTVINPASMTKILTVLVAAEQLESMEDLEDRFTITREITDYSYVNDCSAAGFAADETVTVRDLFYGTVLPSGADAAAGLAMYTSGSLDAFVELMNQKLEELGLSSTAHFTNCVGLYDPDHHCTVYDMAMILEAALDNELCREVLSAKTYTTSATDEHPEGILLSNWFLRRIEDKDTGGRVISGKTGYVVQSGSCAASYGVDRKGNAYLCVTADATSSWRCIYDHVALYKQFAKE